MAISPVVVQSMTAYQTLTAAIAADAIDTADGNYIDVENVKTSNLLILIECTSTDVIVTFGAADNFSDKGIGELNVTTITGLTGIVLESARFKDEDERIIISTTTTGNTAVGGCTLRAVELP